MSEYSPIKTIKDAIATLPLNTFGAIIEPHLRKIGNGGTHDVYILDEGELLPTFVFKLCKTTLDMTPNERQKYRIEKSKKYDTLRSAFPDVHNITYFEHAIQTPKNTQTAIFKVLPFEYGFFSPNKWGIQTLEFNWDELDRLKHPNTFQSMKNAIFHNTETLDIKSLLQAKPTLRPLIMQVQKDPSFKKILTLFCQQLMFHHLSSGDYVDLTGINNIFIYKDKQNKWRICVGSVLKSANIVLLKRALDALELNRDWVATGPDVVKFKYLLREAYDCLRVVRTLGQLTGITDIYTDKQLDRLIANAENIESLFFDKEKGAALLALHTKIQQSPVSETKGLLSACSLNPIDDTVYFQSLLNHTSDAGKKLHVAYFIHTKLPLSGPEKVYGKWCCVRAILAKAVRGIDAPAAKKLAIACLSDTLWDPKAPRDFIKADIARLK